MEHILSSLTPSRTTLISPTSPKFPHPSFLTPPDDNQPLDFSAKKPRLSPPSPSTPILSIPYLQPRRLQQDRPSINTDINLPDNPLPLTLLQQNIKNSLQNFPPTPVASQSPMMSPMSPVSPFLFNPSLCFPSLLQMMSGHVPYVAPSSSSSSISSTCLSSTSSTSTSSVAGGINNDKTELLKA